MCVHVCVHVCSVCVCCVCVRMYMSLCVCMCVCVCVCVCVCLVCVCPETVSAVLEFTFVASVIAIILHVWMCVFVTDYMCVNTQSIDILL